MKTKFTSRELVAKGFTLIGKDGEYWLEYVFDNQNWIDSNFLSTNDITSTEDLTKEVFSVINGVYQDDSEPLLTENQIDHLIKTETV